VRALKQISYILNFGSDTSARSFNTCPQFHISPFLLRLFYTLFCRNPRFAFRVEKTVFHVYAFGGADARTVESAFRGTLDDIIRFLVVKIVARFHVRKGLRQSSALALYTAEAFCVVADGNNARQTHAFEIMLAIGCFAFDVFHMVLRRLLFP
jgi:hypothetical protein